MKFKDVDLDELMQLMNKNDIAEITLNDGRTIISVKKACATAATAIHHQPEPTAAPSPQIVVQPEAAPPSMEPGQDQWYTVRAPLVGTFYRSPAPDAATFVEIGDKVETGDTLCIIEAMKNMNEIQCDHSGLIREICLKNGEIAQFDQILFRIEPIIKPA